MRCYEAFCGVRVVTFCILSNHFHLLVEVPRRPDPDQLPDDSELVDLVRRADCTYDAGALERNLARFRKEGNSVAAEQLRERFFSRMWDVSWFLRLLKQRFSQWINNSTNRTGYLWEGRFRSVLVEGPGPALATIAAYIDLNPVRAGMVEDPKDYRWCGYAQAVAGGRLAREGLGVAVKARLNGREVGDQEAMAEYRAFLFESGREREAGRNGEKGRRGFSQEEIQTVLAAKGKLELGEALLCKVRYFTAGMIFGSRAFVNKVFASHRELFGQKRKSGARKMRGINAPGLYVARALQVKPIG
jgi:REP element-mobilizing transposase RayT